MATPSPELLLEQLKLLMKDPTPFVGHSKEIIKLNRSAAVALEGPFETFQRLAYSPLPLAATRIAQDYKIFQTLVENKDEATNAVVLAAKTGLKPKDLELLLDYMTTQFMVEEVSPNQYKATKLSEILVAPIFNAGITHSHDLVLPAFASLHASLSSGRTAFSIGHHTDLDAYSWVEEHPTLKAAFHDFMEVQFADLPNFLTVFQFESYVGTTTSETPIFVDVGGGLGHQAELVRKKFPSVQGRVILQDRPNVISQAEVGNNVEKMVYDYLTPQPVKGACIEAMNEKSVIVIDEKVLLDVKPEGGVEQYTTALGLAMLALFKALERKEGHWRKLLGEVGLEIREIKKFTEHGDAVIVAGKKSGVGNS